MSDPGQVRDELLAMSRKLGEPAADLVILGEGNTSAQIDDETFWVKASGAQLPQISAEDFVRVRFGPVLSLFDSEDISDETVAEVLTKACLNNGSTRPSTEALMHALLLQHEGVKFVGHTHPTALTAVLCSQRIEEVLEGRLFPDEIVCCGVAPAWVPYTDPGVPLARRVAYSVKEYIARYDHMPHAIWMQNHGLVAVGTTTREVENITAMSVKAARVLLGTYLMDGPHFLAEAHVRRLTTRPDEQYRQSRLGFKL